MKVAPSILTCDFAHLADELDFVKNSGADLLHIDVMDGVFVPNLSLGVPVIASMRPACDMFFDVHLMMQHPDRLIESFAKAGADSLNIHLECDAPVAETLQQIRSLGKQAAVTLKPATPAEAAFPYLELVDMVLVMTVEPGFGGQKFMIDQMDKVRTLRAEIDRRGLSVKIQVDGGINAATAIVAAEAGADIAVVGSALFNAEDPVALVRGIQAL